MLKMSDTQKNFSKKSTWLETWGLYYKKFYGSNCCRIVIS
jgi:hypothetical protein